MNQSINGLLFADVIKGNTLSPCCRALGFNRQKVEDWANTEALRRGNKAADSYLIE